MNLHVQLSICCETQSSPVSGVDLGKQKKMIPWAYGKTQGTVEAIYIPGVKDALFSLTSFQTEKKYRVSTQTQIGNLDSSRLLDCPEWTRKTGMKLDMHRPGSNTFFPVEVEFACTAQFAVRHRLQQCQVYTSTKIATVQPAIPTDFFSLS